MTLAPGPSGVASILVKGSGSGLGVPARALDLPVRVQLQSENGGCWEASYDAGVSRNGAGTFKARGH
jgi:hypothetical protein